MIITQQTWLFYIITLPYSARTKLNIISMLVVISLMTVVDTYKEKSEKNYDVMEMIRDDKRIKGILFYYH